MRRADQITGIIVLIFSLAVMEGSRRMPPSATFGPGAGFLPFWLGVLMAVLSILLIIRASRQPGGTPGRSPLPNRRAAIAIAATVAGLAAFIVLVEPLGFLLATALLTAFLLRVVERERWRTTALVAAGNAVGLYVIFQILLGVNLPKNMLGF
jgi:putative tricarboxylic transport membrane protein